MIEDNNCEERAGMAHRSSPSLHPQIQSNEEGAGVTRRIRRRRGTSPAEPGSLPVSDDMLRQILLRISPQPSTIQRASAVCKRWRGLINDPMFQRKFCIHHRKPPLLGIFTNTSQGIVFTSILDPPDRIPPQRFDLGRCSNSEDYDLIDCRQGFVLVKNRSRTEVVVCDTITSEQRRVAVPPEFETRFFDGAVLCAAGDQGHVHGACHSSPFKVLLLSNYKQQYIQNQLFARLYTSETGTWGNIMLAETTCEISGKPVVLVGNCLYWLSMGDDILKFDMSEHSLTLIRGPPVREILFGNRQIIQAEDGAVGYAILSYPHFEMWQRNINGQAAATWVLGKTIKMHTLLRLPSLHDQMCVQIVGYDEDEDVVFLCYGGRVYMVQLKSMQSKKLNKIHSTRHRYFPFKSFFTSAIAGQFNGAGRSM